ncbi:MAG: DUF1684 domain-containing protein [Acidimicrobiales bacterium]
MSASESEIVLELVDYRRRVVDLYAGVRQRGVDESAWCWWVEQRERLLASHSQSALAGIDGSFASPPRYFDYDSTWCVTGQVELDGGHESSLRLVADDGADFSKIATVRFDRLGVEYRLGLYWLRSYGGGLFVPFRDATNGEATYGAGRYVIDTAKGADLGLRGGRDGADELLLDFNFAYHPSCAWDPRWQCPLAPVENHLDVAVTAGERKPRPLGSES